MLAFGAIYFKSSNNDTESTDNLNAIPTENGRTDSFTIFWGNVMTIRTVDSQKKHPTRQPRGLSYPKTLKNK